MLDATKAVLVSGATGRQGGGVVRHLLGRGWKVRALSRSPGSAAARELTRQGVEVVQGDMEDPDSLARAVRGIYGVYSVQDFWAVGARREVVQGKNLADAAAKAGVEHMVYSSVGGAERRSGIDHWESKWEIERHIRGLGLPATMLRPVAFMENYYVAQVEIGILKGRLVDPIRPEKTFQTIASDDIGAFAAVAFERPAELIGAELEIAGSELTNPQAAAVFSRVLGRPVKFRRLPMTVVRLAMGKEFYQMFRWFNESGFQADVAALRRQYPEIHLHTLEEWLRAEGWHKRARQL
ncbi:MAG TPA: NmrA/HSCARG family protein, partial [Thermoanaerobaculia bacterium]|nr:NmrA/HSCARG family protein [Thermoanaerobaculia bacterium]